jgi:hypothetical protein
VGGELVCVRPTPWRGLRGVPRSDRVGGVCLFEDRKSGLEKLVKISSSWNGRLEKISKISSSWNGRLEKISKISSSWNGRLEKISKISSSCSGHVKGGYPLVLHRKRKPYIKTDT